LNLFQYIVMAASILIMAGLLWAGRKVDRIGVLAFVAVNWGSPLLSGLEIGNIRWGVALLSVAFSCVLIGMVAASRRWWIIAAAGFQLVATASYAVALADPDFLIWTGITLRLLIWILQMCACLFGIAEALSERNRLSRRRADARPLSAEYKR
jgi:hypothetical protein